MSGRLIILPHKSWNVWNRDNVEKVLRDERLHREQLEQQQQQQRRVRQEALLSTLKRKARGEDGPDEKEQEEGEEAGAAVCERSTELQVEVFQEDGHINFFAEAERQHREMQKNKEYELEKQARELLEKRRSGVAPWSLGEGALEHKKLRPWYEQRSSEMPDDLKQKEDKRKSVLDPMAHLLHPSPEQGSVSVSSSSVVVLAVPAARSETREIEDAASSSSDSDSESGSSGSTRRQHKKKHKKDKKERKSKSATSKDKRSRKSKRHKHRKEDGQSPSSAGRHERTKAIDADDEIAALRKRRMEREQLERKRAAVLLAEAQMASPAPLFPSRAR